MVIPFARPIGLIAIVATVVLSFGAGQVNGSGGYAYPIDLQVVSSFSFTHPGYPATDIFATCGVGIVAPVSGSVDGLRRSDLWNNKTDNPWLRGGKFVSIVGTDGVRYYMAHLDTIASGLKIGSVVQVGQRVGTLGRTGRAGACHLHFGISPPCPNSEWWVRRGVIWSAKYLTAWRQGSDKSPVSAIQRCLQNNPKACVDKEQLPWSSN
ncbi:MAG: M23 family metallopeptidase [Actinomycetota bacterium]